MSWSRLVAAMAQQTTVPVNPIILNEKTQAYMEQWRSPRLSNAKRKNAPIHIEEDDGPEWKYVHLAAGEKRPFEEEEEEKKKKPNRRQEGNGEEDFVLYSSRRRRLMSICIGDILPLFNLFATAAARKLGISNTSLKAACRHFGMTRWPRGKLQAIKTRREYYVSKQRKFPRDASLQRNIEALDREEEGIRSGKVFLDKFPSSEKAVCAATDSISTDDDIDDEEEQPPQMEEPALLDLRRTTDFLPPPPSVVTKPSRVRSIYAVSSPLKM